MTALKDAPARALLIWQIRKCHQQDKSLLKKQMGAQSSMTAYIRVQEFDFDPDASDVERKKVCDKTDALIAKCRAAAKKKPLTKLNDIERMVFNTDENCAFLLRLRNERVGVMEKLVKQLPAYRFVKTVKGFGKKFFAQLIGECGDLTDLGHPFPPTEDDPYEGPQGYVNPEKIWKRLGAAPYKGHALSTYLRGTWRPRKLTPDEWTDNPFNPERYGYFAHNCQMMLGHQLKGARTLICEEFGIAPKTKKYKAIKDAYDLKAVCKLLGIDPDSDEGQRIRATKAVPKGPYGEIYCRRYAHTTITHPDWTDGQRHADARRIMGKQLIEDLWIEWNTETGTYKRRGLPAWRRAIKRLPERAIEEMPAASFSQAAE